MLAESAAASRTKRKKKVNNRGGAAVLLQAQQERFKANQEAANAELVRDARKAAEKAAASQAAKDRAEAEHTAKLAKAPMKSASKYIGYAAKCLGPGLKHFFDSFGKDDSGEGSHFEDQCRVFRSSSLFNPCVAAHTSGTRALTLLEDLELYKAINKDMIRDLKDEWDEYKALSEGVDAHNDVLSFFRDHQGSLPTFK